MELSRRVCRVPKSCASHSVSVIAAVRMGVCSAAVHLHNIVTVTCHCHECNAVMRREHRTQHVHLHGHFNGDNGEVSECIGSRDRIDAVSKVLHTHCHITV